MMNYKKVLIAIILTIVMPLSQAHASVPEVGFPTFDFLTVPAGDNMITVVDLFPVPIPGSEVNEADQPFFDFLVKEEDVAEVGPPADELKLILNEELSKAAGDEVIPQELVSDLAKTKGRFWTKGKVLLTTGVLLSVGVLFGVLAFAFSGSGSGSGSGDGTGSGGGTLPDNNGGNPNDPNPNLNDPGNNPNDPGGFPPGTVPPGGDDNPGPTIIDPIRIPPSGIPHNPEPSTLLLLGLGLLMPFFRKRGL